MGDGGTVKHLVCLGMGFSASALAALAEQQGWNVSGTSRSARGVADIRAHGWRAEVFDGEHGSEALRADAHGGLSDATHLVISIPPGEDGDPVLRHHAEDIAKYKNLEWIGYLSTVGVYGDHDGAWVDETTTPVPTSKRSKLRLDAERAWQDFATGKNWRLQIFRLAGIYGPGRSAVDQIGAGKARRIVKKDQVFNRIHVDDIARVLSAGMAGAGSQTLYNVADDEPSPPQDVVAYAAELLGVEPPPEIPFETADLSPMARSFYGERKRVRNDRIKTDLGVHLAYPSYRDGLKAVIEARKR